jgi:hypothetical protein
MLTGVARSTDGRNTVYYELFDTEKAPPLPLTTGKFLPPVSARYYSVVSSERGLVRDNWVFLVYSGEKVNREFEGLKNSETPVRHQKKLTRIYQKNSIIADHHCVAAVWPPTENQATPTENQATFFPVLFQSTGGEKIEEKRIIRPGLIGIVE